jgi:hypothetical protein
MESFVTKVQTPTTFRPRCSRSQVRFLTRLRKACLSFSLPVASLVALVPLALFLAVLLCLVAVLNFCAVVLWAVQSVVSRKAVQK